MGVGLEAQRWSLEAGEEGPLCEMVTDRGELGVEKETKADKPRERG